MTHNAAVLRLFATAAAQSGVLTHRQAIAAGLHPMALKRLVQGQRWLKVFPGVYADPEKSSFEQQVWAAWLWAGKDGTVSHRAAGKLLGLDRMGPEVVEVTLPRGRNVRARGVVVHQSEVSKEDRRMWQGLPVTSPARTLADLAGVVEIEELAMAVDCAWRRKLVALEWLERRVNQLGSQGRPGMRNLARVVADCRERGRPLDSALEVRLWWLIKSSRLPRPVPGKVFDDDFGPPGRMDFAYPAQHLAIEADGFETHGQREIFERDCDRLSRIAAMDWRVIHVTWRQLETDPERVVRLIAAALANSRPTITVTANPFELEAI